MVIGKILQRLQEHGRHYASSVFRGVPQGGLLLIHNRFWFCMRGIQFPLDHFIVVKGNRAKGPDSKMDVGV